MFFRNIQFSLGKLGFSHYFHLQATGLERVYLSRGYISGTAPWSSRWSTGCVNQRQIEDTSAIEGKNSQLSL